MLPAIPVLFVGAALLRWWRGHSTLSDLTMEIGEQLTGVPLTLVSQTLAGEKNLRLAFPKDGVWEKSLPPEKMAIVEISEKDFGDLLLIVILSKTSNDAALGVDVKAEQRGLKTLTGLLSHATDPTYFTPRGGVKYAKFLLQRFGDGVGEGATLEALRRVAEHYIKEGTSLSTLREWMKEVPAPLFVRGEEEGGSIASYLAGDVGAMEIAAISGLVGELGFTDEEKRAIQEMINSSS